MKQKGLFVLAGIFLFLYLLNYLTPMAFGDDYLYSFVWQGKSMFIPLSEDAVRISTWRDLLISQLSHYLTWGGRTVAHVLAQLFLWAGKDTFNVFNSLAGTILVVEIYCLIHRGNIGNFIMPSGVLYVFFALWAFTPAFSTVFFWQTAACNYLWTSVIIMGFLLPYVHKYYFDTDITDESYYYCPVMFFAGILAGWTNENSICWIILILFIFLFICKKDWKPKHWMYFGFVGLMIGYALLMGAPGNLVRLNIEKEASAWLTGKAVSEHLKMLFFIFLFQSFLWYFNLRSLFSLREKNYDRIIGHDIILVKVLCATAFGSTAMMVFSTGFPPRSGFFGTILLIIASGILLRVQKEQKLILIQVTAKKFLTCVACVYFFMTSFYTVRHFYNVNLQMNSFLHYVKQEKANNIVNAKPFVSADKINERLSGFHLLGYELSEDENDWRNAAFARYYGIKGIRMVEK